MSKRADEAAIKAYPEKIIEHVEEPGFVVKRDLNRFDRNVYIQGYDQAEKDLALTWEDVRKLCSLSFVVEVDLGREISDKQHYKEVLRRFNEQRTK